MITKMIPLRNLIWALLFSFPMLIACTNDKSQVESSKTVTHTVVIENMRFKPDTLTIQLGDTVEWINRDIFTHDVTSTSDPELTSGLMDKDDQYERVVDEDFEFFCSLHPSMTGIVIVN